ncbi:helix-turn-helix domain-containing protein [Pedobacter sp. UYP1]|uniref:winged helix-turn-helix transcriptional regulator n=1 Tax=Pedobacter sp. UYP1 TaxID=1756396 RepID=UPI0033977B07
MAGEENKEKPYICTVKNQEEIKYAQDALYVLSGKWRMPIIVALYNGLRRYRDIARNIPGITFTMLSRDLQSMELNKLVIRIEDPDFPKTVEYMLTDYCKSLYPIVESLIDWGKQHRQVIRMVNPTEIGI